MNASSSLPPSPKDTANKKRGELHWSPPLLVSRRISLLEIAIAYTIGVLLAVPALRGYLEGVAPFLSITTICRPDSSTGKENE